MSMHAQNSQTGLRVGSKRIQFNSMEHIIIMMSCTCARTHTHTNENILS